MSAQLSMLQWLLFFSCLTRHVHNNHFQIFLLIYIRKFSNVHSKLTIKNIVAFPKQNHAKLQNFTTDFRIRCFFGSEILHLIAFNYLFCYNAVAFASSEIFGSEILHLIALNYLFCYNAVAFASSEILMVQHL